MNPAALALLSQAPELAVLDALEATATAAALALRAVHPELEAEDFAAAPLPPSLQAAMADAILTHLQPLGQALRRYRTLLVMQQVWDCHTPPADMRGF